MAVDLRGRSLLSLVEETPEEIGHLLDRAAELKAAQRAGTEVPRLAGRNIALIFEKTSTRTRSAFEVAAAGQGASTTFLETASTQIGHKESIPDTARVLGRMFDAIQYRGADQSVVEDLAAHAGVPVYNGLTDDWHPTQMLADALTMREHAEQALDQTSFAYLGDARNNMGNSLLLIGAKLGMDVRIGAPRALQPTDELIAQCQTIADQTGARLTLTEDPQEAVRGVDFVHTDIWVSMGEPASAWGERIEVLLPYQVNAALMEATGNPAAKFMHCLPALHDAGSDIGRELIERYPHLAGGAEVTDEVFESEASIVFDQAENRMHTIKALLVATLVGSA
ncbi:ornithine carbamoyltransferase [Ornithinimicrobium murale]|uniref:ornithine carbamoyltransferase n=1 Tax=Ornithinimicrobium murale TaxID=1050153 RepID=UPI000E0D3645|nr:ornithine carbamoyltransferase [Ornithinimicrobium murale]